MCRGPWSHPGGAAVLLELLGPVAPGLRRWEGAAKVGRGCELPGIPRCRFPAAPGERL